MKNVDLVKVGMIGGGTVGSGVYHALTKNGELMRSRLGVGIAITKVAVKAFDEPRPYKIPKSIMCLDWQEVVNDPSIQVVIELVGGTGIAKTMVLAALKLGKPVITANKALLAAHGPELFEAARKNNTNLYYEASVAGGIPIIKVVRESLVGNRFERIYGIVNGTCNYILTRMKQDGADFAEVLSEAQRLGYAEAEPSLDVDGHDAAHKVGILASLAHGFWVNQKHIHVEGIRSVTQLDIRFAAQLGYTIKLLAIVKKTETKASAGKKAGSSGVQVSVYPTLVPDSHVLASVSDVFNAVFVRGDIVGDTLYYGRGAGKDATASAVLSDLADAALDLQHSSENRVPPFVPHERNGAVLPIERSSSRTYVRLSVLDEPGVVAKVTAILEKNGISIASLIQPEGQEGGVVPLVLMMHSAPFSAMNKALKAIGRLKSVKAEPVMFRVEDFV